MEPVVTSRCSTRTLLMKKEVDTFESAYSSRPRTGSWCRSRTREGITLILVLPNAHPSSGRCDAEEAPPRKERTIIQGGFRMKWNEEGRTEGKNEAKGEM
jgi:hypothetical protein